MPLWFVRGLRRGVVTTHYPARPEPSARFLPTPPAFLVLQLTADVADRLVDACPTQAIERHGAELVVDLGRCTGCGRCAAQAPDVVVPSGDFELATTRRQRLVKRIPIMGSS